jgi:hypothetical protein
LEEEVGKIEKQKHQLIEDHRQVILDLCEASEREDPPNEKYSYRELLKLYLYAVDKNQSLKCQLLKTEQTEPSPPKHILPKQKIHKPTKKTNISTKS